jgi:integrase
MRIDRIRTADVENTRNLHLDGRAPESANHWLRNLKLLFGWAVKRDLIPSVPWRVKMLKVQKKPRVILPTAKASAWLAAVDQAAGKRTGIGTAIRLMLGLGLRESESLSSRWEWLDPERSIYTPGITKGREAVALPVPGWLIEYLEPMKKTEGMIVRTPRGRPYCPGSTRVTIKKANAAAGTPGLSAHRLRSSFATLLSEGGTPVQTIQRMLRHKDVKTTVGYCEIDMSRVVAAQNEIARKMGFSYLNPAVPHDAGGRE